MNNLRISAVSYLNTLPFVYGIRNSGLLKNFDLQLDVPSECAKKFFNNDSDIALVPVAALKKTDSYNLLNDFCIGSNDKVRTVVLLSQAELKSIKTIHLDYHSLTSVNLARILAKYYWEINPEWANLDELTEINMTRLESLVAIGDKTFFLEDEFSFVYDLAHEWKNFTGLPFVFACWVAHKNVDPERINDFTNALGWGVKNKKYAIKNLFNHEKFPSVKISEYLKKNIDFIFDSQKHQALELFLDYVNKLRR